MARIPLPRGEFTPHPAGQSEGFFYDVEDLGIVETRFGSKPMIALKVESTKHFMPEDHPTNAGQPFIVWIRCTVSNDPRSNLRKYREVVLGRSLTKEEVNAKDFDPDAEFLNKKITYTIQHNTDGDRVFANVTNFMCIDTDQAADGGSSVSMPDKKSGPSAAEKNELPPMFDNVDKLEDITDEIVDYCKLLEDKTIGKDDTARNRLRQRHLDTTVMEASIPADAAKYAKALLDMMPEGTHWSHLDDLPF